MPEPFGIWCFKTKWLCGGSSHIWQTLVFEIFWEAIEMEDAENAANDDPDDFMEMREVCNHRAEYIRQGWSLHKGSKHAITTTAPVHREPKQTDFLEPYTKLIKIGSWIFITWNFDKSSRLWIRRSRSFKNQTWIAMGGASCGASKIQRFLWHGNDSWRVKAWRGSFEGSREPADGRLTLSLLKVAALRSATFFCPWHLVLEWRDKYMIAIHRWSSTTYTIRGCIGVLTTWVQCYAHSVIQNRGIKNCKDPWSCAGVMHVRLFAWIWDQGSYTLSEANVARQHRRSVSLQALSNSEGLKEGQTSNYQSNSWLNNHAIV